MKKVKSLIVAIILVQVVVFTSCDSRSQKELEGIVDNPTYNSNIKPILDNYCINCHKNSQTVGYFPDLDTYQNVLDYHTGNTASYNANSAGDVSGSKLLCSVQASPCTGDRMPKGGAPLTSGQITLLTKWIANNCPQ